MHTCILLLSGASLTTKFASLLVALNAEAIIKQSWHLLAIVLLVPTLRSSLLAECPHGVPSLEGAVDRNGNPMFYLNSFSACGPQGLLPSHSVILRSA